MAEIPLSRRELIKKMAVRLVVGIPAIFAPIFIPAGTFAYWEAWLYLAVILIPFAIIPDRRDDGPLRPNDDMRLEPHRLDRFDGRLNGLLGRLFPHHNNHDPLPVH